MKFIFIALACALASSISYGRDSGFALECSAIETGQTQIISFLEVDTDKRVRYLETESRTMWDSHEWLSNKFIVRSFMQVKGDGDASLISYIEIEKDTLAASFFSLVDPIRTIKMQCQRWTPQSRNK